MTTKNISISLPKGLFDQMEKVRKREHRTRSELIREALRVYTLPAYIPTKAERRAIEQGKKEIERGEFVTLRNLKDIHRELDIAPRQKK